MFAELYLTDGETKIDFMGVGKNRTGFGLIRNIMSRPNRNASSLSQQAYGSTIESYEVFVADYSHDGIAARTQQLDRMLEQAQNFFETSAESNLVYLAARTLQEEHMRYAVVYGGTIETYNDVFHEPFIGKNIPTLSFVLGIERTTWQSSPPTEPGCIEITNAVEWNPNTPVWSSVRTLTNVQSLFVTSVGTLLAGAANIERSADNGDNWTVELTGGDATVRFWQFIQVASRIWTVAGETSGSANAVCGIYYSDDDGLNWTQHTASLDFYSLVYRGSDDTIFFGGDGEVRYIQAGGSLTLLSTLPVGDIKAIALTYLGSVVLGDEYNTWHIPKGSLTISLTITEDIGPFLSIVTVEDYLILGSATYLSISHDDGLTWAIYWYDWGIDSIKLLSSGDLIASRSATTTTFISISGGINWISLANSFGGNPIRAFAENGNDYLFAGAVSTIYRRVNIDSNINYGLLEPSCVLPVYVVNHRLESNWSHIFVFDSSSTTYTSITPETVATNVEDSLDFTALPSPVGTNDILYVGISTALADAGPFSNIFIEITEPNYTLTLAIEYYNGATWTTLTTDYVNDNTKQLKRSGVIVWHLDSSVAMSTVSINSITAYWIRFRVTATGSLSTLLPKIRNIYIAQKPYIEVTNLPGDIPALSKISLENEIDVGSPSVLRREMYSVIMGLRSVIRGESFTAYINLAQKQNPPGITVALITQTAFVTDNTTCAAGQFIRYTPATLDLWLPIFYVLLDPVTAKDFEGTFQVYLRLSYQGAVANDVLKFRLSTEDSVRYLITYTELLPGEEAIVKAVNTTDNFAQILYLGQYTIHPDRLLSSDESTFQTRLTIEGYVTSAGVVTVDLHELILIPSDEWIGDFTCGTNGDISLRKNDILEVDSATFPKRILRAILRLKGSNMVNGNWKSSSSGVFSLQAGLKQRLWILTSQLGTMSPHTLIYRVKLWCHNRWLGLRGND